MAIAIGLPLLLYYGNFFLGYNNTISPGILSFAVHRLNGFRRMGAGDTLVTKHVIAR